MTTQPTRADWWREVTDPDEVIPAGCPARAEWPGYAYEAYESVKTADRPARFLTYPLAGIRVFIDSRWTPPLPAYKVGDVIENTEDVDHLPDGSVFIDCYGQAWQTDDGMAYVTGGGREFVDGYFDYLPITVVYVPKVGGDDD
jgi:hypothetical protein